MTNSYFSEMPEEVNQIIYKNVFKNVLNKIENYNKKSNLNHTPFLHITDIFSSNTWNYENNSDYVRKKYLDEKYNNMNKRKPTDTDWIKLMCDLERPVVWADRGWYVRKWKCCGGNWGGDGKKIQGGINWGGTYEPGVLSEYRYKMLTKNIPSNRYERMKQIQVN